jgi:hypothetical protein
MMLAAMPAAELLDGVVFRLVKATPQFPRASKKPLPAHFAFSSEEERLGHETGQWLLSVWDRALTLPAQARTFMETVADRLAFGLAVPMVRAIKVVDAKPLRVIRDPLPPAIVGSGRDGHCGIEGLHGEDKLTRKRLWSELADLAFALPE